MKWLLNFIPGINYAKIVALLLALIGIAGVGWKIYHTGLTDGRIEGKNAMDAYVNEQKANALSESMARRHREDTLIAKVKDSDHAYQTEKSRRLADAVTLDGVLREFEVTGKAADSSGGNEATTPQPGANGTGGLERELLNHCAAVVVGLAKEADRLESQVVGLQNYIRSIGLYR